MKSAHPSPRQRAAQDPKLLAVADREIQAGIAEHNRNQLGEARRRYLGALQRVPGHPEALHLLGVLDYQNGDFASAISRIRQAIQTHSDPWLFHFNLGRVLKDAGKLDEACLAYREALKRSPRQPQVLANLAAVVSAQGDHRQALYLLDDLCRFHPQDPSAWTLLGNALGQILEFHRAEGAYRRALELQPDNLAALHNLGGLLVRLGRAEEAIDPLEKAHRLQPDSSETLNRLGAAYQSIHQPVAARRCYVDAVTLNPANRDGWKNLGDIESDAGNLPEAREAYQRAYDLRPEAAIELLQALLISPIMSSSTGIASQRQALEKQLVLLAQAARSGALSVGDPIHELGQAGRLFYLAYHGENDRKLMQAAAALFLAATPSLAFSAPWLAEPPPIGQRRLRVGWLSAHFSRHTIGTLFEKLILDMPRQQFEVHAIFAPGARDQTSERIAVEAERNLFLVPDLAMARQQVADLELDILIYPDLGMDPFTYFLAFARLARRQCVAWGHPSTSGLPSIDVYISSVHQEIDVPGVGSEVDFQAQLVPGRLVISAEKFSQAQARYSERLVLFSHPLYSYQSPSLAEPPPRKSEFGFPDHRPLYLCPQSLFKLHPDFDELLDGILARDPEGILALPAEKHPEWQQAIEERWNHRSSGGGLGAGAWQNRVRFFPRMAHPDYLRLLQSADVILDSRPFGGGLTTLDALALGCPIVSWPGQTLSGRFVAACYRRMGLESFLSTSAEDYIQRALALGSDSQRRAQCRQTILDQKSVLFDHQPVLLDLCAWLEDEFQPLR